MLEIAEGLITFADLVPAGVLMAQCFQVKMGVMEYLDVNEENSAFIAGNLSHNSSLIRIMMRNSLTLGQFVKLTFNRAKQLTWKSSHCAYWVQSLG